MNLLNKTTWVVASLLAATSAFAQDKCAPKQEKCCTPCPAPCDFKEMMPGMPGYNAPSRINVCGNWDLYTDASFIYWQIAQDNMAFALANQNTQAQAATPGIIGSFTQMDFDYKPGFQVGVGMNYDHDNWDSYAEYTRIHGTNSSSASADTGRALLGNWGSNRLLARGQAFSSASASFKTNLDFVDWVLGRSYFVGKNLTFHPVVGVRGAWITQNMSVHYKNPVAGTTGDSTILSPVCSLDTYSRVHSWGVGARTGVETNWLLGQGIRLYGNGYADMLYTKYKLQNKSIFTNSVNNTQYVISKDRIGAVRTHLDLELGFGWGSYFDNNNWHIDLSAGYGFQVFFNQNMFRNSNDDIVVASGCVANGDMTAQGLTAKVRIDF